MSIFSYKELGWKSFRPSSSEIIAIGSTPQLPMSVHLLDYIEDGG